MGGRGTIAVRIAKVRSDMVGYTNRESDATIMAREQKRGLANTRCYILRTPGKEQWQVNPDGQRNYARSAGNGATSRRGYFSGSTNAVRVSNNAERNLGVYPCFQKERRGGRDDGCPSNLIALARKTS